MSRLCRLKSASHGEDGQWAYEEIVRLREKLDYANAVIEQRNMEADRLQVENDALEKDRNDWIACHARMFKQRDELRAENEALRKDAERIDFIESDRMGKYILRCGNRWYWRTGYGQPYNRVGSLREAIDAARKGQRDGT